MGVLAQIDGLDMNKLKEDFKIQKIDEIINTDKMMLKNWVLEVLLLYL